MYAVSDVRKDTVQPGSSVRPYQVFLLLSERSCPAALKGYDKGQSCVGVGGEWDSTVTNLELVL